MRPFKQPAFARPSPPLSLNGRLPLPLLTFCRTLCSAVLLLAVSGCGGGLRDVTADSPQKESAAIEAEVLEVKLQPWARIVRSYGSLVADETAVVGSRQEGRVELVHVDLGDAVKAGAPLVTLSQSQFQLRVEQAEAQLRQTRSAVGLNEDQPVSSLNPENAPPVVEQKALWIEAQANVERARQLKERNTITPAEFEQLTANAAVTEARYRSALNGVREKIALIGVRAAELSLAREALADTVIRMPFDGFLQQKQVSPGSYVRIGDSVGTVVRTDSLRFRGTIPERYATHLATGQTVQLQIETVPDPLTVTISRISPALDMLSRSLLFEARIDNQDGALRSGLFAEARVVIDQDAQTIAVPRSALVEFAGAEKVWKVVDGEAREQPVLAGERREDQVEILEGLEVGDLLLLRGAKGTRAKVIPLNLPPGSAPELTAVPPTLSDPLSAPDARVIVEKPAASSDVPSGIPAEIPTPADDSEPTPSVEQGNSE